MKVLINAVSAKMGGAAAYLFNFLTTLASLNLPDDFIVFVPTSKLLAFKGLSPRIRIETETLAEQDELSRMFFDQWTLRRFARQEMVDCIFSTANFGVIRPPLEKALSKLKDLPVDIEPVRTKS